MKYVPPLKKAHGQLLPLMDMIFLLLVVFIFMIVQMRPDFSVTVELPTTELGKSRSPATPGEVQRVFLSVTGDDRLYVNKDEVRQDNLVNAIFEHAETRRPEHIHVVLRGDKKSTYRRLAGILATLMQNDLKNVYFDVEARKP